MSDNRVEQRIQNLEDLYYDYLHHLLDSAVQFGKNLAVDALGSGVVSVTPTQTAPASMSALVSMLGISGNGDKLMISTPQSIDCSVDYLGVATVPTSGAVWISCFALGKWTMGDQRPDGDGEQQYHSRTEAVELRIYKGTKNAPPINPGGGAIRIWSYKLTSTTTSIATSGFNTDDGVYADWLYKLNDRVPKSGGHMTGPLFFDLPFDSVGTIPKSYSALACATGAFSFPSEWTELEDIGFPNFNWHKTLASPMIDLGDAFAGQNLIILPIFNIKYYSQVGVVNLFMNPIRMRNVSDIPIAPGTTELVTEAIYVYQEEDASGYTGRFQIVLVGMDTFLSRFTDQEVKWMALKNVGGDKYSL